MKYARRPARQLNGLIQIGATAGGRPVWSIAGGAADDPLDDDEDDDEDEDDDRERGDDLDPRARAKIRKANNEAKNLRTRVKELDKAAERLKEIEDAEKSEIDKANEKLSAAERRAEDAELRALRIEIAAEKGLTPALAKRLTGSSREELEEDAEELVELLAPKNEDDEDDDGGPKPPRRPRERQLPDGRPSTKSEQTSKEIADEVLR